MKKVITWVIVLFVGFYIVTNHQGAANVITGLIHLLNTIGNALAGWVKSL